MSVLSLTSPFPIFTDVDGNPLEDGYIYIGTAGFNPETNPISAYWDAALTVPAAQPIRTLGGYPSRSGAAARIYVNASDCSVLVKNKNGSLIFSALNQNTRLPAELLTFTQSGTGAVARTVQSKLRESVSVKDFGAVGNGTTDDTVAIQAALDYVASLGNDGIAVDYRRSGSTLYFPNGTYKTTAALVLVPGVYNIEGAGRFKAYPQKFEIRTDCLPTIMPVHAGRNCFTVAPGASEVSFRMFGINIATLEAGNMPTSAIGFDCTGSEFQRDFTLDYVGIFGFTSAIDVYGATGVHAIGVLKVHNCSISRNTNLVRCLNNTYINLFQFTQNESGQNTNGMVIKGSNILITDNSLESIANPITVSGTFLGGRITNNYFEANTGSYVISLESTHGVYIGQNSYNTIAATERIRLTYDVNTVVEESVVLPFCNGSWNVKTRNNTFAPTQIGAGPAQGMTVALDYDGSQKLDNLPIGVTEFGAFTQAETAYATSGTGLISHVKSGISISIGSWIGVSFLVTYKDEPALTPLIYLRPNTTDTDGQVLGNFYEFNGTPIGLKGRTFLFFGVTKVLNNTLTSMQSFIYPFGISPVAGLICKYSGPLYYNFGTTLPANAVQAFALHRQVVQEYGTWTPSYAAGVGTFATMTMDNYATCTWVRVGRVVFITASFRTDNVDITGGSGYVKVTGLPFKVADTVPCVVGRSEGFVNTPVVATFVTGSKDIELYKRTVTTGGTSILVPSDLTAGASANKNDMQLTGWYLAAD